MGHHSHVNVFFLLSIRTTHLWASIPAHQNLNSTRIGTLTLFSAVSSMHNLRLALTQCPMAIGWRNDWMSTLHKLTDCSASRNALGHQGGDTQWWRGLLGPCFFSFQTEETLSMCHIYPSKHPSHGKQICFLALTSFRLQQIAFGCQPLGAWAEQLEGGVYDPEGWKEKTLSPNRLVKI